MRREFEAFTIKKVEVRSAGIWGLLQSDQVLAMRAGTTRQFRVTLTSAQLPTRTIRLGVPVPLSAGGKFGFLDILGGNSFFAGGGGEEEPGPMPGSGSAETLDELLREIASAPRNDHVLANLSLFRNDGSSITRSSRVLAPAVVDGGVSVEVRGIRAR